MDIKIEKIHRLPQGNRIRAFVDISINRSVLIKGLRLVDGQKGLFLSMPQEMDKNERWFDKIEILDIKLKEQIQELAIKAYEEK